MRFFTRVLIISGIVMLPLFYINCQRSHMNEELFEDQNQFENTFSSNYIQSKGLLNTLLPSQTQVLIFNASSNKQDGGKWSDVAIDGNGQLAMIREIKASFCSPICPQGKIRIGISYTADFLIYDRNKVLSELIALVKSAKENNFYFTIHANHEWVLNPTPNFNPFGGNTADWAEHSDWNTPINRFWVNWGTPPPEIGLKPNFESPLVRSRVKSDIKILSQFILEKIYSDPQANNLFLGLDIGWETEVTPQIDSQGTIRGPLGYAALKARGFSASNLPLDFQAELGNIVQDYLSFVANSYQFEGIPKTQMFTHMVAVVDKIDPNRQKRNPINVAKNIGITLGVSAFGGGFDLERIYANLSNGWIISETDPRSAINILKDSTLKLAPQIVTIYAWGDNVRNDKSILFEINQWLHHIDGRKIYRLNNNISNGGTFLFSFGENEGVLNGYKLDGYAFSLAKLYSRNVPVPLYRCILKKPNSNIILDRMLSNNSSCEGFGYLNEAILGYMSPVNSDIPICTQSGRCLNQKLLYRCYDNVIKKHLSTINIQECVGNMKLEGQHGYVWY